MKKIILSICLLCFGFFANAQMPYETFRFISIDDNMLVNSYLLNIYASADGISYWADLEAEGDTENYKIECEVELGGEGYEIKFKHGPVISGVFPWEEYMSMYWENESQPVFFTIENFGGKINTVFKQFRVKDKTFKQTKTEDAFELVK